MKRNNSLKGLATLGAAALVVGFSGMQAPAAYAQDAAGLPTKPVTITLSDSPIRTALDALFKSAGVNYTIDPTVTGTVTVDLKNVPFDVALRTILRASSPPLTYTQQNGIYQISQPTASTQTAPSSPTQGNPIPTSYTGSQATDTKQAVVIYLNYVSGALLNYVVGPVTVIPPLLATPGASGGNGAGSSYGGNGGSNGGFGGSNFGGGGGSNFGGSGFGGGSSFGIGGGTTTSF